MGRAARVRQGKSQSKSATSSTSTRTASPVSSQPNTDDEGGGAGGLSDVSAATQESVTGWGSLDVNVSRFTVLETVQDLLEGRSGLATEGREERLALLVQYLSLHYARETLLDSDAALLAAAGRSLKAPRSDKEAVLAARLLSLAFLTFPEAEQAWEAMVPVLTNALRNITASMAKSACATALAVACLVYGGSEEASQIASQMLAVIESDGSNIGATDDEVVVASAIEALAVVVTCIDDQDLPERMVERSFSALQEQLESSSASVRIAAGEAIASLCETCEGAGLDIMALVEDMDALTLRLTELSSISSKRVSKASRRVHHSVFRDVLRTVQSPESVDVEFEVLKFGRNAVLHVDSWAKLVRLHVLRKVITHGIHIHFARNPVVQDVLFYNGPAVILDRQDEADAVESGFLETSERVTDHRARRDNDRAHTGAIHAGRRSKEAATAAMFGDAD